MTFWDNGDQGNGSLVTHAGGMTGTVAGADRSAISPGGGTFGLGASSAGPLRLADNFTITGNSWQITSFQTFAYLTGATTPGITAMTLRIWNGAPNAGGTLVFGDTTTNVLSSTSWAVGATSQAIYRTTGADTLGATRRVQQATVNLNLTLAPGTYWVDFGYTGASFTPPLSVAAGPVPVGNALQLDTTGTWVSAADPTLAQAVELPFILGGTVVAIPEPSTYALMLAGGLAVVGLARRRRNAR